MDRPPGPVTGLPPRDRSWTGLPGRSRDRRDELVPHSPYRLDEGRMGGVDLDLAPEALDADVDQAGVAQVGVVPDPLEKEGTGEHLPGTAGQLEQQTELGRGQAQVDAPQGDRHAGRVDGQVAEAQDGLAWRPLLAPEHGLDAGQED